MSVRIHQFSVENFMRVKLVQVDFDKHGNFVEISGRNGAGKTSFFVAIQALLGGKEAIPGTPVRRGQTEAKLKGKVGDLLIERTFKDGKTSVTVSSPEGRYSNPQEILGELIGELSFDPMEFYRQKPSEQADTLREMAGLDFAQLEANRAKLYTQRTEANRKLKELEGSLKQMPHFPEATGEPRVIKELLDAQDLLYQQRDKNNKCRRDAKSMAAEYTESCQNTAVYRQRVKDLEDQLVRTRATLKQMLEAEADCKIHAEAAVADVAALVDPDFESVRLQIDSAQEVNDQLKANKERDMTATLVRGAKEASELLTGKLKAIDATKAKQLKEAKFPLEGLSLDDSGVTLNGIPLDQENGVTQLRVSIAIGRALNPKLAVLLISDPPQIDPDMMAVIEAEAQQHDFQILMARSCRPEDGHGVVIEDGQVYGVEAEAPAEETHASAEAETAS